MKTKTFTLLQLFSIIDGRLSTSIDDVYDMLNHIFDENFMTHHLPTAMKFLREQARPDWFVILDEQIASIKVMHGNEFPELIAAIKTHFNAHTFEIPQLTAAQKTGFEDYMINNSLLIKKIQSKSNFPGTVRNILLVILLGAVMFFMSSCEGNPDYSRRTVRIVGSRELHSVYIHKCQLVGDTITVQLPNKDGNLYNDDYLVVVQEDCK